MFNDQQIQSTFDPRDIEKYRVVAVLAYILPILFFLPIVMDSNSTYNKHNANQSLSWLLVCIVLGVVSAILGIIPFLGFVMNLLIDAAVIIVAILLAVFAYQGNAVKIPVIGDMLVVFK